MMKPKVMKNDELVAASHPALISAEDVMINDGLRWILSTYYVVLSMRRGQSTADDNDVRYYLPGICEDVKRFF